jgi:hypothetical protein
MIVLDGLGTCSLSLVIILISVNTEKIHCAMLEHSAEGKISGKQLNQ